MSLNSDASESAAVSELDAEEHQQSDLEEGTKKPSSQILRHELQEAHEAFQLPSDQLFFSALSAGMEIGVSLFLMAVVQTRLQHDLPHSVVSLLVANMYSFGFILVILGRSELFTEQTSLAALSVVSGQESLAGLMRVWCIVYVANIIGAALSAMLIVLTGPALGVIDVAVLNSIAGEIVHHRAHVIVLSGILAGWMMGLLSWLVAAGRDTISQIVIVWLITAAIGLGHLHHSILGSVEVLAGVFTEGGPSLLDFGHFLIWATLGNAIGGPVLLALLKYTHAKSDGDKAIGA